MDTPPPRLIAHVFIEKLPSLPTRTRLREQLGQVCSREGSQLVDLVFDHEQSGRQPADYPSLVRIAAGEADGLVIVRMPMSMEARPTPDLLCSALIPPLCMFDKAELRRRGLLPKLAARRRVASTRSTERPPRKPRAKERLPSISGYDRSPAPERS